MVKIKNFEMTKKEIINHIESNSNKYNSVRINRDGEVTAYSYELDMRLYIGNIDDAYFQVYWRLL